MIRSAAIVVVVVLMVLRTAAYPVTTTETTTETTIGTTAKVCPDMSRCIGTCSIFPWADADGCPMCICYDPFICQFASCGIDEQCVEECPGGCNSCVPLPETTTVTTTVTETTIGTTVPVCEDMSWCTGTCSIDSYSPDGCPTSCICNDPICMFASCDQNEQCVENDECPGGECYSCVPLYDTNTEPTKDCPYLDCGSYCANQKIGSDGCPTCDCQPEDACQKVYCAEDEECVPTEDYCNEDTCFYWPACTPTY